MKSSILKFMAMAGLALAAFGFAQEESPAKKGRDMGVGIRAAFDYGWMYGIDENESEDLDGNPSGIGFEGGIQARIEMVNNLYFKPEVNIAYMSTSHEYLSAERTYSSTSLEIPLMFQGVIKDRFYVNAGPQLNLVLSSNVEAASSYTNPLTHKVEKFPYDEDIEMGSFTFGIVVGAGVGIVGGLNLDVRFYMGLSELFPDVTYVGGENMTNFLTAKHLSMVDLEGAKMMSVKVGLSYWFI